MKKKKAVKNEANPKENSSKFKDAKSQLIKSIAREQDQRENPVSHETMVIIITRTFRMLEKVWDSCGSGEVRRCIQSHERRALSREDAVKTTQNCYECGKAVPSGFTFCDACYYGTKEMK